MRKRILTLTTVVLTLLLSAMPVCAEESALNKDMDSAKVEVNAQVPETWSVTVPKSIALSGTTSGIASIKVSGDIAGDHLIRIGLINPTISLTSPGKASISSEASLDKKEFISSELATGEQASALTFTASEATAGTWTGGADVTVELVTAGTGDNTDIEVAPAEELANWEYTLDNDNNEIRLTKYVGESSDVTVFGKYAVNEKKYNTVLNSELVAKKTYIKFRGPFTDSASVITSVVIKHGVSSANCAGMFFDRAELESVDLSGFNTSSVTDMSYIFSGCSSLTTLDLSNFNTSSVTDMSSMFDGCSSLTTLDLSSFDTSSVTDMNSMFDDCSSLTELDLSSFDTSNVTDMNYMFEGCQNLQTIYAKDEASIAKFKDEIPSNTNINFIIK